MRSGQKCLTLVRISGKCIIFIKGVFFFKKKSKHVNNAD